MSTDKTKRVGPSPRPRKAPSKSLEVAPVQESWTRVQVNALKRLGFEAPPRDMDMLFHVSKTSGLDPFRGQLYMARNGRGDWEVRTTIAGLLAGARAATAMHNESLAISAPEWADRDGQWRELWAETYQPSAARVTVRRDGHPFTAVALYSESVVLDEETGRPNRTWTRRGASQLAKCAKAAALRDACPVELSGLYTDDETHPDNVVTGTVVKVPDSGHRSSLDDALDEDD